jgi:hypothetical protein
VTAFTLLWIAQIALGGVVYATNPKRNDVSDKAQRMRNIAIFGGVVPCVGIMLISQLIALSMYRGSVAMSDRNAKKYGTQLETSFGAPRRRPPAPAEHSDNPLGGSTALPDDGGSSSRPPSDNPFL